MNATLDCLECMIRQALRAARVATPDLLLQRRILDEVAQRIPAVDLAASPAASSLIIYQLTAQISGKPDPYREMKAEQNRMALALEADLRSRIRESEDPLDTALHLAAAGNIIDLGILQAEEIDIEGAIEEAIHQRFAINHSDALKASLAHCNDFLYLLDNAGEIVFDKLLIEELQKITTVTAVVKGGPMLNDATLEDAESVGLGDCCTVIDNGGAFIGSPLHLIPKEFYERMAAADIVLGKGQGNYETIDTFPGNVFLLLRAKCESIARHMGVRFGQVALISTRQRSR